MYSELELALLWALGCTCQGMQLQVSTEYESDIDSPKDLGGCLFDCRGLGLLYRFLWPVTPPWLDDIVWPLMVFALLVLFFLGK